jgi:hypothetical protein
MTVAPPLGDPATALSTDLGLIGVPRDADSWRISDRADETRNPPRLDVQSEHEGANAELVASGASRVSNAASAGPVAVPVSFALPDRTGAPVGVGRARDSFCLRIHRRWRVLRRPTAAPAEPPARSWAASTAVLAELRLVADAVVRIRAARMLKAMAGRDA